jgi:hypothetical protein
MSRKTNTARKPQEPIVETPAVVAETPKVTYPTSAELIASGFTTKSARIRELHRLGMTTGDIARQETNGLYQHAYNVIHKPLKRPATPAASEAAPSEAPASSEAPEVASEPAA